MSFQQYNIQPTLTPVRVVSTVPVAGTYVNGPLNNGVGATFTYPTGSAVIDGVSIAVGDRILLAFQSNIFENGIYVCTQAGSTGVSAILQRSADMQCIEQLLAGQYVSVGGGVVNHGSIWTVVSPLPAQMGINNLSFASTPSSSSLGTMATQNNFSVNITGGTIAGTTGAVMSGTTAAFAGGGTTNTFTATGLTAGKVVVANILTSSNSVSITKAVPGTNTLAITFSADPGAATTVNWIAAD